MNMASLFSSALYHCKTLYLFTRSDFKTVILPVTMFAVAVAPEITPKRFFGMLLWIWINLLQANVSNQSHSCEEDKINKPWRPIPSGRITSANTSTLRWISLPLCLGLSSVYGRGVVISSALLSLVDFLHDDVGFHGHFIPKNACNVAGYLTFEAGALMVLSGSDIDHIGIVALTCSGLVIATTVHAQDFPDVEGDRMTGRKTLPVVAPVSSRYYMFFVLFLWSCALALVWGLGAGSTVTFVLLGCLVGGRYVWLRHVHQDRKSYVLYNAWLIFTHILPINARKSIFLW